jgi:hypothetical protein
VSFVVERPVANFFSDFQERVVRPTEALERAIEVFTSDTRFLGGGTPK